MVAVAREGQLRRVPAAGQVDQVGLSIGGVVQHVALDGDAADLRLDRRAELDAAAPLMGGVALNTDVVHRAGVGVAAAAVGAVGPHHGAVVPGADVVDEEVALDQRALGLVDVGQQDGVGARTRGGALGGEVGPLQKDVVGQRRGDPAGDRRGGRAHGEAVDAAVEQVVPRHPTRPQLHAVAAGEDVIARGDVLVAALDVGLVVVPVHRHVLLAQPGGDLGVRIVGVAQQASVADDHVALEQQAIQVVSVDPLGVLGGVAGPGRPEHVAAHLDRREGARRGLRRHGDVALEILEQAALDQQTRDAAPAGPADPRLKLEARLGDVG